MRRTQPRGPEVDFDAETLTVYWSDASPPARYSAVWLRDNSPAPDNRDPVSGQRLMDIALLPDEVAIRSARADADGVELIFAPDGHATRFSFDWLRGYDWTRRRPRRPQLWGRELQDSLPRARFADLQADPAVLRDWLAAVRDLGTAVMFDLPPEPGRIFEAVALFGFVRETNYGRLFDVKSKVDPNNLAYSNLGLGVHTDNPYRDPVPSLQLLHCLSNSTEGGENMLRDGFHAAEQLRQEAPEAFALLTAHEVPFRFADRDAELTARGRSIECDSQGQVVAVRYNNRSTDVFDLPPDVMGPFYDAYRRFGRLLHDSAYQVTFKLAPGELFIVDNRRVLHGRTAFSGPGSRHLQGCYADRDGLLSTLAVLERKA